jgi:hypothetical protein
MAHHHRVDRFIGIWQQARGDSANWMEAADRASQAKSGRSPSIGSQQDPRDDGQHEQHVARKAISEW